MAASTLPMDWEIDSTPTSCGTSSPTSYAERFVTSTLLPGLPNDLALECLARVPPTQTKSARKVNTVWRKLFSFPNTVDLGAHRRSLSSTTDPVIVSLRVERQEPSNRFHAINRTALFVLECPKPESLKPPSVEPEPVTALQGQKTDTKAEVARWVARDLPNEVKRLVDWCVVTNGHHVFVIGGKDADTLRVSSKVWRYDVYSNSWKRMADMCRTCDRMKTGHVDGQPTILVLGWDSPSVWGSRPDRQMIYHVDSNTWEEGEYEHEGYSRSSGISSWKNLYDGRDFVWANDVKNRCLVFEASDPHNGQDLSVVPHHPLGFRKAVTSVCAHRGKVFALWTHGLDMAATLTVFRDGAWFEVSDAIPTWTKDKFYQYLQLVSAGGRLFVIGTRFSVLEVCSSSGSSGFSIATVVEDIDLPASSFLQCVGLVA